MAKKETGKSKATPRRKEVSSSKEQIKGKVDTAKLYIQGKTTDQAGAPKPGLTLKAFDQNIGTDDNLLGKATTDLQGHYAIPYTRKQLKGKPAADLVIKIYQNEKLLQQSEVIVDAGPEEVRDFMVPVDEPSEFLVLTQKIRPVLPEKLRIPELAKPQIEFLNKKTGIDAHKIERLAQSYKRAEENERLATFYYAMLSQNLPPDPAELLNRDRASITGAVQRAGVLNLIPALKPEDLDDILDNVLPKLRVDSILKPASAGQPASLGDILGTMRQTLTQGFPEKVASVISDRGLDYTKLQDQLKTAGVSAEQAIAVERTLRIGDLTRRNIALMKDLQEIISADEDASLKSLVKIGRDEWIEKAYTCGVPAGSNLSPEDYARELERSVDKLHPTAMLASHINSGDLVIERPGFEKIGSFLMNNPDFDIFNTNIPVFITKANLSGIESNEQFTQSLLKLQRVKKLSTTWNEAGALLNNDLDSALQVVGIGRQRLQQCLSAVAGPERATVIYEYAKKTHDLGLAIMSRVMPRFSPTPVAAMGSSTRLNQTMIKDALKDFPALEELFGSLDYCDCDPDQSVLSPAAYFVDVLQFLKNAGGLDTFLNRRPDLVDLQLSPENTDTELPYIDLVLEILENALALPRSFDIASGVTNVDALLDKPMLPPAVVDVLQETSLETVGRNLHAFKESKPIQSDGNGYWTVIDQQRRWTLRGVSDGKLRVALRLPGALKSSPVFLPLTENLQSALEALDQGVLSDNLEKQMEDKWLKKKFILPLFIVSHEIIVKRPGRDWKGIFQVGIDCMIRFSTGSVTITFISPEGGTVSTKTFNNKKMVDAIMQSIKRLDEGRLEGPIRQMVPPGFDFTVTRKASEPVRPTGPVLEPHGKGSVHPGKDEKIPSPSEQASEKGGGTWSLRASVECAIHYCPAGLEIFSLSYQTDGETEDLKAFPRNQNPLAYQILRASYFPWSLPFNLPLESVRGLLERTGITRRHLIECSKPDAYLEDVRWAYEVLGISSEEAEILTQTAEPPKLWSYWGFTLEPDGKLSVYDANAHMKRTEAPVSLWGRVSILMQQARISYEELWNVLHTYFVGASNLNIKLLDGSSRECGSQHMYVELLQPEHLDRIHRFVRLWRKTGWKMNELDLALYVLAPVLRTIPPMKRLNISSNTLLSLAHMKRLQEMFGLPIKTVLRWFGDELTLLYKIHDLPDQPQSMSLYEELFLNPLTQNPSDPDFALNSNNTDLLNQVGKKLGDKLPLISAALGIRQEDAEELISSPLIQSDNLTLRNLFQFYRTAGFARALGISFEDFSRLELLLNYSPFNNIESAVTFTETVQSIYDSGFTIDELSYLLLDQDSPGSSFVVSDDQISEILSTIRTALQTKLNAIDQQIKDLLNDDPNNQELLDKDALDQNRLEIVLPDPGVHQQLVDVVLGAATNLFDLEMLVMRQLLVTDSAQSALLSSTDVSHSPGDGIEVFLDATFVGSDPKTKPDGETFPAAFRLVRRLHKVATILERLDVKPGQIAWFADQSIAFTVLDLDKLPVESTDDGMNLFSAWRQMVTLFKMRDSLPKMNALLAKYSDAVKAKDVSQAAMVLADGLKIPSDIVQKAAEMLGITDLAGYRKPSFLKELMDLLSVIKKLGADSGQIDTLTMDSHSLDTKAELLARSLLRAKYGSDSWREIVKPISDKLRIRQRDVLVDYLMYRDKLRDADDLYEYYLIDPQMSPLMMTSRLVQATAAMQLFVQQGLLNLVEDIELNKDDRKRWAWMKNYRVWQANREVFLFPENWLYPELRDDKTQIFNQIESGLAQEEPTYALAKNDVLVYLDELADVTRIKVYGMYEDVDERGTRVLYVAGRLPNKPYHYYWRKCENFGDPDSMRWNGWERIDMDLNSDHVIPFVFGGNFHIAWPIIEEKVDEYTNQKVWEIQLAWVSRTTKGWSRKKVSKETLSVNRLRNVSQERGITFRLETCTDSVIFYVYGTDELTAPVQLPQDKIELSEWVSDIEVNVRVYKEFTLPDGSKAYEYAKPPSVSVTAYFDIWEWTERPYNWNPGSGRYTQKDKYEILYPMLKSDGVTYSVSRPYSYPYYDNIQKKTIYVEWRYKQVVVEVSPMGNCTRPAPKTYTPPSGKYISSADFEIAMPCSSQSATVSADRRLKTVPVGKFILKDSNDVEKGGGSVNPSLVSLYCAGPFANGYKEYPEYTNGVNASLTVPNALIFETLPPGEFFVVQAATNALDTATGGTWYYDDKLLKLYIQIKMKAKDKFFNCLLAMIEGDPDVAALRASAYSDFDQFYLPESQSLNDAGTLFKDNYKSNDLVEGSSVEVCINFNLRVPSAIYNWEVFFHAPLLIAGFLTRQQRFSDAQQWLHYVFNPTAAQDDTVQDDTAKRFWQFLPFRTTDDDLHALFMALAKLVANKALAATEQAAIKKLNAQIHNWLKNPFSPFAVARARWSAFQWRTLFSYLDNLIAWGDQMFRRFTRESVNEAILYYVLASKLLGPRPQSTPRQEDVPALCYRDIYSKWDDFWNDWYTVSNDLPTADIAPQPANNNGQTEALTSLGMSCFCIPPNDKLDAYWDKVEDRLFKIRNCMDVDGITRKLPLFAPPIDPELLVRATAAGLDIDTVLSDLFAPLLPYRFSVLLQKANEICGELKSLGATLLAALEKKDAEELALLRSSQEIEMLNLITTLKEQQIKEGEANLDVLGQNMALAKERYVQYQKLLGKAADSSEQSGLPVLSTSSSLQVAANAPGEEAGLGLIQHEVDQLASLDRASSYTEQAGIANTVSSILHALPNISTGFGVVSQFGGSNLGPAAGAVASYLNMLAGNASHEANRKGILASYQRRQDEWVFQSRLALEEMKQINKQIVAAEILKAIAERELENHKKQIENAKKVDEFMHDKYTNQELYSWMVGEISTVYFGTYQLAHDMAKRVEKAFQSELGVENTNFIQFGYWDSLKKGLLAGENLSLDLKRMETAYFEQNRREFEMTKHISLLQLNPIALIQLRETGTCTFSIPEELFDFDCPGHYFRRIKSVSVTIPCVTGPYTSVSCKLTLQSSSIRKSTKLDAEKGYSKKETDDDRFKEYSGNILIMTSSGQSDSGMFETNLRDERYLPFEGSGVIGDWKIELPAAVRQFDYDTITDIVLHMRYTARDSDILKGKAAENVATRIQNAETAGCIRLFSIRHEFPTEWAKFRDTAINDSTLTAGLSLTLLPQHYPYWSQEWLGNGSIKKVQLFAEPAIQTDTIDVYDKADQSGGGHDSLSKSDSLGNLLAGSLSKISLPPPISIPNDPFTLYFSDNSIKDLWLAITWGKKTN